MFVHVSDACVLNTVYLIIIIIQRFIQVLITGIAKAALTCDEYVPHVEHNVISLTRTSPRGGQKGGDENVITWWHSQRSRGSYRMSHLVNQRTPPLSSWLLRPIILSVVSYISLSGLLLS